MNILSCQNETQRFEQLLILIHVFSPSIQTHENFMNFLKENKLPKLNTICYIAYSKANE